MQQYIRQYTLRKGGGDIMTSIDLIKCKMTGSINTDSEENAGRTCKLSAKLKGSGSSRLALLGWQPLELSGHISMEEESAQNVEITAGSCLNIGPPFHKTSRIHIEFNDFEGRTWRLLGSGDVHLPRPWKTGTAFSGDAFLEGERFGSWNLKIRPGSISFSPEFFRL